MPVSPFLGVPPRWLPAPLARRAYRTLARRIAPILCYHAVVPDPGAALHVHAVSPAALHRQLAELRCHFRFVLPEELAARIAAGEPVEGLAAVTFDDGYRSVLESAVPVLAELEIPATLYVTTCVLGGEILWRDKIRYVLRLRRGADFAAFAQAREPGFEGVDDEGLYHASKDPGRVPSARMDLLLDEFLEREGLDPAAEARGLYLRSDDLLGWRSPWLRIGNHSHRHYMLATMTAEEVAKDVAEAQRRLRALDIEESDLYAVPFGGLHTFGPELVPALAALGYRGYLTMSQTVRPLDCRLGAEAAPGRDALVVLRRFMPRPRDPWVLL